MLEHWRRPRHPANSPRAKLRQELLRRHVERILLQHAADDDHRMGAHHIYHGISAKFGEIVYADDRVVVATPHIVHARFKLNQVVDERSAFSRPIHLTDDAAEWK